jgi:hypothetical protein
MIPVVFVYEAYSCEWQDMSWTLVSPYSNSTDYKFSAAYRLRCKFPFEPCIIEIFNGTTARKLPKSWEAAT